MNSYFASLTIHFLIASMAFSMFVTAMFWFTLSSCTVYKFHHTHSLQKRGWSWSYLHSFLQHFFALPSLPSLLLSKMVAWSLRNISIQSPSKYASWTGYHTQLYGQLTYYCYWQRAKPIVSFDMNAFASDRKHLHSSHQDSVAVALTSQPITTCFLNKCTE